VALATDLNADMESFCSTSPTLISSPNFKRLYGLGLLPLVRGVPTSSIVQTISQIAQLPHLKGIIIGTRGLGKGLDDEELNVAWEAIEKAGLVVFLHPHYGVGEGKEWGAKDNGHVLPLALGFPMETTIAITRLILSGAYDRYPNLKILLAHSGGALPQLSSRLASCITHDPIVAGRLRYDVRYYLGKLWFDAVAYGAEELEFVSNVIGRASQYGDTGETMTGSERMVWGTDHPFFPPLEAEDDKWMSVVENLRAVEGVKTWSDSQKQGVRSDNAIRLFDL